jgi:YD repeat-containing protein
MTARLTLLLLFYSLHAGAVVDMKTANYADSWIDLVAPGSGYDLRVQRSYNSRTIFSGIFGFGWCSDFETKLEVTPEGNIKVTECGAGAEVLHVPKKFDSAKVGVTISAILAEVKKRSPEMSAKQLKDIERDLTEDDYFREQFAKRFDIKGSVSKDTVYIANGREKETVVRLTNGFKRTLADGTYEHFDEQGRLTAMFDRNTNSLKLSYEKNRLTGIVDNQGRRLTVTYQANSGKVKKIVGPNNLTATYIFKGEDLIEVSDSSQKRYKFAYDDVHNLTKITYPDGKTKGLTYNKDKDWVTSFQNEKGCVEKYDYQINKEDPRSYYKSLVVKKCGDKVTNESVYEFFNKQRSDGTGMYLSRVRSDVNGLISDVTYHEVFGRPTSVTRGKVRTEYSYFDTGLVKQKREDIRTTSFEYKNSCNKVSKVEADYFDLATGKAKVDKSKVLKKVQTKFVYDPKKCNLTFAENSEGQTVKLDYDVTGRISTIEDQSRKLMKISYDTRFGKPEVVSRPGLGTIKVSYKGDGEIKSVDSKEGPIVAVQVATIFNNLLDLIGQATPETNL